MIKDEIHEQIKTEIQEQTINHVIEKLEEEKMVQYQ
ncbi:hypothetical protein ACUXAQ_000967 [Staphylococcus pasteuri]